MGATEILVPIGAFVMISVITSLFTRLIATGLLNRTIRDAMKNDPKAVPLLVERLERHAPWGDALLGWIFLALAVAMALLAVTDPDDYDRAETLRAAIVPAIVGIAVLAYAWLSARKTGGG